MNTLKEIISYIAKLLLDTNKGDVAMANTCINQWKANEMVFLFIAGL